MFDQLKSGRVDAVEPLEPFVGQMLGAGYKSIGDPLLAVADPVLFPFWIADADWARANRDVLKRWVASLQDALESIQADEAKALLYPYPADAMDAYEVSNAVNSTKNNAPDNIVPVSAPPTQLTLE